MRNPSRTEVKFCYGPACSPPFVPVLASPKCNGVGFHHARRGYTGSRLFYLGVSSNLTIPAYYTTPQRSELLC